MDKINSVTIILIILVFMLGWIIGMQGEASEKRGLKIKALVLLEKKNKILEKILKDIRIQQEVIGWNGFPTENAETIKRVKTSLSLIERDIEEGYAILQEKLE